VEYGGTPFPHVSTLHQRAYLLRRTQPLCMFLTLQLQHRDFLSHVEPHDGTKRSNRILVPILLRAINQPNTLAFRGLRSTIGGVYYHLQIFQRFGKQNSGFRTRLRIPCQCGNFRGTGRGPRNISPSSAYKVFRHSVSRSPLALHTIWDP
jgi:hypothetical protein